MNRDVSRRETLRLGAAAAGLGAVGSLSGCSQIRSAVPFLGGGASYTQWLHAPGAITDDDHYDFSYTDYEQVRNNEDEFDEDVFGSFEDTEDNFPLSAMDLGFEDVSWTLGSNAGGVVSGSFNVDDVGGELEDNDLEEDDDYEGYTLYINEDSRGVAVQDGTAVYANTGYYSDEDVGDILETIIDTKAGNEDRYTDEEEDFQTLVNKLGSGTSVSGQTYDEIDETDEDYGQFEGAVASGSAETVNGETTTFKNATVFDSSDDIPQDDFEDYVDDSDYWDEFDNVSVSTNGRAVVITADLDTDEYGT